MRIPIYDDKYIIKSDRRQYTLYRVTAKKEAGETDEPADEPNLVFYGSFDTIPAAIKTLAKQEARLTNATTMEGYIRHIKAVEKKIELMIKELEKIIGDGAILKKVEELEAQTLAIGETEPAKKPEEKKKPKKKKEAKSK